MGQAVPPPIADAAPTEGGRARDAFFRRALVASDLAGVAAAFALTAAVFEHGLPRAEGLILLPLVALVSKLTGLYDRDELLIGKATTIDEIPAIFNVATLLALVAALGGEGAARGGFSTLPLLVLGVVLVGFLVTFRTAARAFAVSHTPSERCLVVGDADACDRLRLKLADSPHANSHVLGYVPFKDRIRADDPAPMGWLTRLEEVVRANDVHRVIVAPRDPDSHALLDAVRRVKALGAKISILPGILEVVGSSVEFDDVEGMTVLGVRRFGLSRASRAIKRTLDIGGAVGTLLAGAPFMLVTAVAIKVDSGGPIFFRQTRMGRDDETFDIVKFRTMHDGAERHQADLLGRSATEELFKVPGDPRITRVGRWLRRTSLDELPQLFNVLRGEMSLVGPRPLVLAEDSRVEGWHRRRLHLKPGMTGPWQVLTSGRIPLYEMVKIDYRYASSWTLWNDVKILIQTFFYVTARRGM